MVEQSITAPPVPKGKIIAEGVAFDDYMERYASDYCEWVRGVVIKMSPVTAEHDGLNRYISQLMSAYFALNPIGLLREAPFVMRTEVAGREPDLQIILNDNPGQLTETAMNGPADIVIEIVSKESVARDYGEKFEEYEKAGVREYWLFDPIRTHAAFHRLGDDGVYNTLGPDSNGDYITSLLPKLILNVPTLWQDQLPDFFAIGQSVQTMFGET